METPEKTQIGTPHSKSKFEVFGLKMDTPEKTQIGTPLTKSKFEDSPVFNYINNLSPIRPMKSVHVTQPFNPAGFSSLPSVFTSPHANLYKESRFFKIHNSPDPSKQEFSTENGNKAKNGVSTAENSDPQNSNSSESPSGNFGLKLPQILNYDCVSPDCDRTKTTCATDKDGLSEQGVSTMVPDKGTSEVGLDLQKMCDNTIAKDETPDWENLIPDAADLLIFCSPKDSEAFTGLMQKDSKTGLRNNVESEASVPHSCDLASNIHRGMRRRCLDFETLGARRKSTVLGSNSGSTTHNQSLGNKPGRDSPLRVLPGIGLHLNALAVRAKENQDINVMQETAYSGKIQISFPGSNASIGHDQEQLDSDMITAETRSGVDCVQIADDVSKDGEDLNASSPKKKRRKPEHNEEGESCKRCNCKKSKCLKLYCECFAAGVYCIGTCSCLDCFNKPIHEDTVLATRKQIESRNPLAFAPKVIRGSETVSDIGDESTKTPASARHKRGCNCKKSNCLKKYCECYQGGVGCSINCRCEGCKNVFGRKDGTLGGTEAEPDEEQETSEKSEMVRTLPAFETQKEEQKQSSVIPMTPVPLYRPVELPPFSSKTRQLPQSLLAAGTSSSGLYSTQTQRFDKNFETGNVEIETPEILVRPPMATIKNSSPNSKRISSPHYDSSPGRSSSRKLILQSIPSFPSLTPNHYE